MFDKMKLIKLTQGQFAQVDDSDIWVNQWKWCAVKDGNTYYAVRSMLINGKYRTTRMHRLIMNTPADQEVDHQDHNGLNCQRHNMRNCTSHQNRMNGRSSGKSKYLGVSFNRGKYITAQIKIAYKSIYLGTFPTEIDAARAYDKAASEHFGKFANLNFK